MILINNLTTRSINKEILQKIAQVVFKGEGIEEKKEVSLVLVGNARMRNLNYTHRGKNRTTDVLSFPVKDSVFFANSLGEIIISLKEVSKSAKRLNSNFEKEFFRCLIHGLLHLLGYNHKKEKERNEMIEKEKNYLLEFFK